MMRAPNHLPGFRLTAFLLRILPCILLLSSGAWSSSAAPPWIRVSSTHFTVLTDGGEKKGREIALRFEQMRAIFAQLLMKSRLNMPLPLQIIALKTDKEYAQVAPLRQGQPTTAPGFFLPGEDRAYIVLNLFEDDSWRAVSHQFAHLLLNYNYPPTPGWFDEGLAEYFSSIEISDKKVQLGADPELTLKWSEDLMGNPTEGRNPSKSLTELLAGSGWLAIPDLFTLQHKITNYQEGTHRNMFYAESWMVMHYLLNNDKLSETGNYFGLVQLQKMPVEDAIQKAFGMSSAQLEKAVKDYFHSLEPLFQAQDASNEPGTVKAGGQIHAFAPPVTDDQMGASAQPVEDYEARSLVAEMSIRIAEHRETSRQQLLAIAADPKTNNAIAQRALAWNEIQSGAHDRAIEQLNQALDLDSKDVWVRYLLASVKYHLAEAKGEPPPGLANMMQDLRLVLDWYPEFAEAYNMLAMARLEGGGINSALDAERAAIQLSPRSEAYLLNMARIYISGKKWDAATALLEQLKTSQDAKIARTARKDLDDLPTIKKYGLLPQHSAAPAVAAAHSSATSEAKQEAEAEEEQEQPIVKKGPDRRPVEFVKGRLISVDCSSAPAATLTISTAGAKRLKLWTGDFKSLLLIGPDAFSCSWTNQPVSANYKQGGHFDGELVSVEVHQ